jgi:hypothetical protein
MLGKRNWVEYHYIGIELSLRNLGGWCSNCAPVTPSCSPVFQYKYSIFCMHSQYFTIILLYLVCTPHFISIYGHNSVKMLTNPYYILGGTDLSLTLQSPSPRIECVSSIYQWRQVLRLPSSGHMVLQQKLSCPQLLNCSHHQGELFIFYATDATIDIWDNDLWRSVSPLWSFSSCLTIYRRAFKPRGI